MNRWTILSKANDSLRIILLGWPAGGQANSFFELFHQIKSNVSFELLFECSDLLLASGTAAQRMRSADSRTLAIAWASSRDDHLVMIISGRPPRHCVLLTIRYWSFQCRAFSVERDAASVSQQSLCCNDESIPNSNKPNLSKSTSEEAVVSYKLL